MVVVLVGETSERLFSKTDLSATHAEEATTKMGCE